MEKKIRIVNEYGEFSAIEINKAYVECREYIKHYKEVIEKQEKKISELESKLKVKSNANEAMKCLLEEQRKKISALESEKDEIPEELRSKDLNFNLVSKMLDVIELMLTDTQS